MVNVVEASLGGGVEALLCTCILGELRLTGYAAAATHTTVHISVYELVSILHISTAVVYTQLIIIVVFIYLPYQN